MLTKALMKGPTMLQALINLGGMKKVWTAACLVVVAWLGFGLATILAGKELKETMVMVTVTFCSRDLVIGRWLVSSDRSKTIPTRNFNLKVISLLSHEYPEQQFIILLSWQCFAFVWYQEISNCGSRYYNYDKKVSWWDFIKLTRNKRWHISTTPNTTKTFFTLSKLIQ